MNQMEIIELLLNLRIPAIIPAYIGPKYIADIIIGINIKLIFKIGVFIDKNLSKIK